MIFVVRVLVSKIVSKMYVETDKIECMFIAVSTCRSLIFILSNFSCPKIFIAIVKTCHDKT